MNEKSKDIMRILPDDFVYVEGGSFAMGSATMKISPSEQAANIVKSDSFAIGKYTVTVKEYDTYLFARGDYDRAYRNGLEQKEKEPKINVSWENAVDYAKWLSAREGKIYRLATEAEWEYAAKGGQKSKGYSYAGSDDLSAVAWYGQKEVRAIAEVGQKQANELGLYDMSGNVWEWCSDWFDTFSYNNSSKHNPQGPSDGEVRVLRGGSWDSSARFCCTTFRNGYESWNSGKCIGFRLVLEFE